MKFYTQDAWSWVDPNFIVPELFSGFSVVDSVRISALLCFFSQSCVNRTVELLSQDATLTIATPSLAINTSQYSPDTLMRTVIDDLMIDRWNDEIDYERYYSQCKPLQCSYTIAMRGNLLYIFSIIVGIFGGLTIFLKLLSKIIVTIVRNRMRSSIERNTVTGKSR